MLKFKVSIVLAPVTIKQFFLFLLLISIPSFGQSEHNNINNLDVINESDCNINKQDTLTNNLFIVKTKLERIITSNDCEFFLNYKLVKAKLVHIKKNEAITSRTYRDHTCDNNIEYFLNLNFRNRRRIRLC